MKIKAWMLDFDVMFGHSIMCEVLIFIMSTRIIINKTEHVCILQCLCVFTSLRASNAFSSFTSIYTVTATNGAIPTARA